MTINHNKIADTDDSIRPLTAIVMYGNDKNSVITHATLHRVKKDNTLGLGSVMNNNKFLRAVNDCLSTTKEPTVEITNPNVIIDTHQLLVWQKQRFKSDMWFRTGSRVLSYYVEWPPLIFIANKENKSLSVFSAATNSRLTMETRLYHAPLMNISSNGLLCLGTATLPSTISSKAIDECESALIDSQFTHTNHENTLTHHQDDDTAHIRFWKTRADKKNPKRVTAKDLVVTGTFKDVLNRLINNEFI